MNILVTGGCGFIGSHLVDRLLAEGHEVIVLDDLSEGKEVNLRSHSRLDFQRGSILADNDYLFDGIDIVFHLAALTRPQESIEHPLFFNEVNVEGTVNILLGCIANKVKRVVFASTASLYGEQEVYPTPETAQPNPMSPYGLQKFIGEEYCKLFTRIYKLETNCLRFFNAYGPRMNPDSPYSALIPKFIKQIKKGEQPIINGHGNQRRDFVHIDDAVAALILASKSQVYGEIFNIGNGVNYSVNEITQMIFNKLNKKNNAIHGPAVIEPTQTLADIGKAKELLGWIPKISLNKGIGRLI